MPGYSPSFVNSDDGSFIRKRKKSEDDDDDEDIKFPVSSAVDPNQNNFSIDFKDVFDRETRAQPDSNTKYGIDQWMLYLSGPISMHFASPLKFPTEKIDEPSKVTVTKIAWGWDHLVILLENGTILVGGSNTQGQLNLNPAIFPSVTDELYYHEAVNEKYEVIDIGCGSNHTVLIVRARNDENASRKIVAWGYHGCLGVDGVNEDDHKLHHILIPGLIDYDNIEFLIWKFNSNAVLDFDNNLYYWGDEFDGFRIRVPEKKNWFSKRVVDLSFGFRHALALLEDGTVYVIDSNGLNRLRYTLLDNVKVVKLEAGCRHSLFLDSKGLVYGFGLTKLKNHNTERIQAPIELEDLKDITDDTNWIDIFAGDGQSLGIDSEGLPYRWDGVTGKIDIIEDLGGKYILEVILANQNIVAVFSTQND